MSRSRKRTPVVAMTTAASDKPFKRAEHQRERAQVRQALRTTADDTRVPAARSFGDPCKSDKDGKHYMRDLAAIAEHAARLKGQPGAKGVQRERHRLVGK
ncbi:MAG: hypothetical protein QM661_09660 [Solimonas sp.]